MKKILALLLVMIMCLAAVGCNGTKAYRDILGEWICIDEEGEYITFAKDGTGETQYDSSVFEFTWEYDAEHNEYHADIRGKTFAFTTVTEEGITYLSRKWVSNIEGYVEGSAFYFRAEDREAAVAAASQIRDNYLDRELYGKPALPLGEEISIGKATVVFKQIRLSEDKTTILCDVSVSVNKDMKRNAVKSLLPSPSYVIFYESSVFATMSGGSGHPQIADRDLAAGESVTAEISLLQRPNLASAIETWGEMDGFVTIKCGETKYYIDLRQYTK